MYGDNLIKELLENEEKCIVEVMAFMSYNPSIGRVLEKGGVKKFQKMAIKKVHALSKIDNMSDFDEFHRCWMSEFIKDIKTNKYKKCSYGQAQKAINVFLKLYIDWANLPDKKISAKIRPFLHVPLDKIIMREIAKHYLTFYIEEIKPSITKSQFSLSNTDDILYFKWQDFFRKQHPDKPLLFDIVWALNR